MSVCLYICKSPRSLKMPPQAGLREIRLAEFDKEHECPFAFEI